MSVTFTPEPVVLDPVRQWRLDQLELAGYPHREALLLSERFDIDLHRAIGLLQSGCPPETAVRILL